MSPFAYDYRPSPYVGALGDLMLRSGDIRARAAEIVAAAQARAEEQRGAAWAGAATNIGRTVSALPGQIADARAAQTQQQFADIKLRDAQALEHGRGAVDAMMQGDQLPAGASGPRQQSYLTEDGLFDIPKMTTALASGGMASHAPELLKGAEQINDSVLKHQGLQEQQQALTQKMADAHTVMLGDLADGTLKLVKAGVPMGQAMDMAIQPALATGRLQPPDYAKFKAQLAPLNPEQQTTALKSLMDQAERIAPTKILSEGATETGRYGTAIAKGGEKPPTEAELALKAAGGDPTKAMAILKPAPKRDDAQLALDAYAKSIGKPNADALTYAERQTFDQNKAKLTSDQAFTQHQRERQYDIANPIPVKEADQNKLEQQYRTVLQRAFSSRAGGIGSEDAKVQQANHLLALLDQTYDPKTDSYTIPKTLQGELAAGLARLVAPGGAVGVEMMREFDQRTAKGDLAGALSYVTGHPFPSATQDFAKLLRDSIERQGTVAEQNREGSMGGLRALAPTELNEERRQALEQANLNPLRQSKILTNSKGERRQVVSIDGGKTWR